MKINRNSPIALIDSGIGGLSLLKNLHYKYPNENYIYLADNLNMPYGNKSAKWLNSRLNELVTYLYNTFNVKMVILACNTASITSLKQLSKQIPVVVIGLDMASLVGEDTIALCTKLCARGCKNINTYPCRNLAQYIEDNIFDKPLLKCKIKRILIKANLSQNNIILGCTHYELIYKEFKTQEPNKKFILPCREFVDNLSLTAPNTSDTKGDILMLATLPTKSYIDKLWKIFKT